MDKKKISSHKGEAPEIWTIGGGKGGTGKSFMASSMAIHLAESGHSVTLIDADIGGANLHSYFGMTNPKSTLTEFFEKKIPLDKLKIRTGVKNLSFIPGDVKSLASDSILYSQKLKLFRHIRMLNSEYVILDVGAGSHNNVIDTFLIADKMIAVLLHDVLAVENLYHFIKNALFRKLKNTLKPYGFKEFVEQIWLNKEKYGIKNLWELIAWMKANFPYINEILDEELSNFRIYFILNKISNHQDIMLGSFIKSGFLKFLGMETHFIGFVEHEENVIKSIAQQEPFMQFYASSSVAQEVRITVENLINGREQKV
ncbi:MAG: P-loop NTPase [Candidatus Aminicenantes bacterium]|nr:P-loop NTPase [Candidatus Aminicenantes bacterium]